MAGMMTARFLLHLRKWEVHHSTFGRTGNNGNAGGNSDIVFRRDPGQGASRSYIDDFGEDPVSRAKQNRSGQHELPLGTVSAGVAV